MAQLKLNTTSSVVDYLKGQNKPSDFNSRSSLYKTTGLGDRLGNYVGSVNQNTALLKHLQTQNNPPTSVSPVTPSPTSTTSVSPTIPPAGTVDVSQSQPATPITTGVTSPTPTIPPAPIGVSEALSNLGYTPQTFSASDILNQVQTSPLGQLRSESADINSAFDTATAAAKKQELETKNATDIKDFINKQGAHGLFFSGETDMGLSNLANSLAASKLGVDRELASKLYNSDVNLKESVLKDVQTLIDKATSKNETQKKDALNILEAQGLTIGPDGKTLVPTLAASKAVEATQLSQDRLQFQQDQAKFMNDIRQSTLELTQAKTLDAANIATQRLEVAQANLKLAQDKFEFQQEKSGAGNFTSSQINKGAANAGTSLEEFKTFDTDTKNYFINNGSLIKKAKKDISDAIQAKENTQDLKDNINKQDIPQKAKDVLNNYIDKNAPKPANRSLWHPSTWF